MTKIAAAVSGAVLLTGAVVLLAGMTPAPADQTHNTVNAHAKGDRLDLRSFGPGCSEQSWPYYDANCIRNAGHAKPVRIVTTDRLPASIRFAASN